jgi:hypothetical protein
MFKVINLPIPSQSAADAAKLPLNVLQVVPDYISFSDTSNHPM